MSKSVSRFLGLVLRHKPEVIGLSLGEGGWVEVDTLIEQLRKHGTVVSRKGIDEIVATNDKKRFVLSEDGARIRAAQGHSVEVDLGLNPAPPPAMLYHGTVEAAIGDIKASGLMKMSRHHVHLSKDVETATKVGSRRGAPIILEVEAGRMYDAGFEFFISDNGVWLTDKVPVEFLRFPA